MLDFCYALNLSVWLQTLTCGDEGNEMCGQWFKANFALSHGPIAWAIVGWKNSLVFHNTDKVNKIPHMLSYKLSNNIAPLKVTSFAVHIMPTIFCYLLRWEPQLQRFKLEVHFHQLSLLLFIKSH